MTTKTSRQIALERRIAMSDGGKKSLIKSSSRQDRVRSASDARVSSDISVNKSSVVTKISKSSTKKYSTPLKSSSLTSRELVLQRRKALSTHGKPAMNSSDRTRTEIASNKNTEISINPVEVKENNSTPIKKVTHKRRVSSKRKVISNTSRDIVLARREAQSKHGKSAIKQNTSAASLARRGDPNLSSREISQRVRDLRSKTGATSIKGSGKCRPCGPNRNGSKQKADAYWKVGESGTNSGQTVTGTQANRSSKTTGNEPSTCRDITGTQYLGTEVINEFCNSDLSYTQPSKINVSSTTSGNKVTGNEVGRSSLVTGNEPGTCKNLTGTEYTSANLSESYCGEASKNPSKIRHSKTLDGQNISGSLPGRSSLVTGDESGSGHQLTGDQYLGADPLPDGKSFEKVGTYNTLNGNLVTGTGVGRSERMTGNESGSCKNITGDEYIGSQQYESFCGAKPTAEARKVGLSISPNNNFISGTMTGRSDHVTGDEPGTCKNVTGTPYAGVEQLENNCDPNTKNELRGKGKVYLGNSSNARLTGKQPGIGGQLTGAGKGACLNPTGTPYVGGDQLSSNCSNHESTQSFANDEKEKHNTWNDFSVHSPSRERYSEKMRDSVTGNQYESGSNITGPFDMAVDKVTGTEQFRFDKNKLNTVKPKEDNQDINLEEERAQSRITGEGQSAGLNITGDDWARGDRVTGTEGASSRRRNPSRASLMNAMPPMDIKRNEKMKEPDFLITGSSGNTKEGQLVTFSGGARG
tara:strand:+ start:253 stop:2514 length:2262 start_codon:yes stop_codon:yes gene_type:complete